MVSLINIKKIVPPNREVTIIVSEIKRPEVNAALLGELVVEQLEKRVAFKRAMREALQRAQKANVNGIKIQVSGRLNGAEIARTEWVSSGKMPLHTLRASIDYCNSTAL